MLMGVLPSATFASAAYSSNLCCTSSAAASATAWDSDSTAYRRTSFSSAATADIRLFAPDHISSSTAFLTTSHSGASHLRAAAAPIPGPKPKTAHTFVAANDAMANFF